MGPIRFACDETLGLSADDIALQILDVANWPDFQGYAFLPGIQRAEFEVRTPQVVGSRIRVFNADRSSHVEEIVDWQPGRRLTLHMKEFSPPVSRLATRFDEDWEFEPLGAGTKVTRAFQLHARSAFSWPALWLISIFLKKAIARHLRQMRGAATNLHA